MTRQEIEAGLTKILVEEHKCPEPTNTSRLYEDLYLTEELDYIELALAIEDEMGFELTDEDYENYIDKAFSLTFGELVDFLEKIHVRG